jgi:hypothetical protein
MFASPLDQCIDHTFLVPRHTMDFGMRHLTDRKEQGHPADGDFPPVVGGGGTIRPSAWVTPREVSGGVQQGVIAATSLWGGSRGAKDME